MRQFFQKNNKSPFRVIIVGFLLVILTGSHLLMRKLGKIATNVAHVGSESIDILALAPGSEALQPRAIGRHRVGRKSLDACDIGDKRVDGVVQVKGYDRSPPNKSERVAK